MQRQFSSIALALTSLTSLVALTANISPGLSQVTSSESASDKYTFYCQDVFDKADGEKIPTTTVWNPQKYGKRNVPFIVWKSQYFEKSGWTSKQRCEKVTEKLNILYNKGSLEYFTHGRYKGYPVVCGVASDEETCNENNMLFTVRRELRPEDVVQRLNDSTGEKVGLFPIYQKSGGRTYIPVKDLLNTSALGSNRK